MCQLFGVVSFKNPGTRRKTRAGGGLGNQVHDNKRQSLSL